MRVEGRGAFLATYAAFTCSRGEGLRSRVKGVWVARR